MSCKTDLGPWNGKIIVDGMVEINVEINPNQSLDLERSNAIGV